MMESVHSCCAIKTRISSKWHWNVFLHTETPTSYHTSKKSAQDNRMRSHSLSTVSHSVVSWMEPLLVPLIVILVLWGMFLLICSAGHKALLSRYRFTVLPLHTDVCFLESLSAQTLVWGSLFCPKGTLLVTVIFFYINVQSAFFSYSADCGCWYKCEVYVCLSELWGSYFGVCVFLGRISKGCSKTNTSKRR